MENVLIAVLLSLYGFAVTSAIFVVVTAVRLVLVMVKGGREC